MLIEFSGNINKENWEPGDEARAVPYFIASVHVVTETVHVFILLMIINVRLYTFHAVCHEVRDQQCGLISVLKTFKG